MVEVYNLLDKIEFLKEVAILEYEEWADNKEKDKKNRIAKRLNDEERKKFRVQKQNFESIELEKSNLIVANYCLPFCNKKGKLWLAARRCRNI